MDERKIELCKYRFEETEEQIRFVNELINEVYTRFLKDILDSRREI